MRTQRSWFDTGHGSVPVGGQKARYNRFTALGALPTQLLLRMLLGLDVVSVENIVLVTAALLALQAWDNIHFSFWSLLGGGVMWGDHISVFFFAIAWVMLALFERFQRLEEEKQGTEPHTLSKGVSRFGVQDIVPLSEKAICEGVEPGLAFLAGAVLRRLGFSMLGWIFICSSVCWALTEWRFYHQEKRHIRDLRNLDKEGRREAELTKPVAYRSGSGSETLHTGIDGLEPEIENRRRESEREAAAGGAL
jgi:hypothetical protein